MTSLSLLAGRTVLYNRHCLSMDMHEESENKCNLPLPQLKKKYSSSEINRCHNKEIITSLHPHQQENK